MFVYFNFLLKSQFYRISQDDYSAFIYIIEGSLEVKLPTICRDGKAEVGRVSEEKSRSEKIRDGEKVHAVVARSTFPSKNVQSTSTSEHFWKLSCRKSARWRGAMHNFQVKMYKTLQLRSTFGS